MMITLTIGSIATPLSAAAQAAGSASIFFTVIDAPRPQTEGVTEPDVSSQEDIVLENVNFAYPIRPDVKVLSDLSLRFPAGKLTAVSTFCSPIYRAPLSPRISLHWSTRFYSERIN